MSRNWRLEKARQNEEASRFLAQNNRHPDWVITTAFYSALHYVEYKAFPFNAEGLSNPLRDIRDYRDWIGVRSLHKAREQLVRRHHPQIRTPYEHLSQTCHNARYTPQSFDQNEANLALRYLEQIREYCKP